MPAGSASPVYVLVSACAAVSGIILVGQTASATPQAALGYGNSRQSRAVMVGAPSLGGGRGQHDRDQSSAYSSSPSSQALNLFGVSPSGSRLRPAWILLVAVAFETAIPKPRRFRPF